MDSSTKQPLPPNVAQLFASQRTKEEKLAVLNSTADHPQTVELLKQILDKLDRMEKNGLTVHFVTKKDS